MKNAQNKKNFTHVSKEQRTGYLPLEGSDIQNHSAKGGYLNSLDQEQIDQLIQKQNNHKSNQSQNIQQKQDTFNDKIDNIGSSSISSPEKTIEKNKGFNNQSSISPGLAQNHDKNNSNKQQRGNFGSQLTHDWRLQNYGNLSFYRNNVYQSTWAGAHGTQSPTRFNMNPNSTTINPQQVLIKGQHLSRHQLAQMHQTSYNAVNYLNSHSEKKFRQFQQIKELNDNLQRLHKNHNDIPDKFGIDVSKMRLQLKIKSKLANLTPLGFLEGQQINYNTINYLSKNNNDHQTQNQIGTSSGLSHFMKNQDVRTQSEAKYSPNHFNNNQSTHVNKSSYNKTPQPNERFSNQFHIQIQRGDQFNVQFSSQTNLEVQSQDKTRNTINNEKLFPILQLKNTEPIIEVIQGQGYERSFSVKKQFSPVRLKNNMQQQNTQQDNIGEINHMNNSNNQAEQVEYEKYQGLMNQQEIHQKSKQRTYQVKAYNSQLSIPYNAKQSKTSRLQKQITKLYNLQQNQIQQQLRLKKQKTDETQLLRQSQSHSKIIVMPKIQTINITRTSGNKRELLNDNELNTWNDQSQQYQNLHDISGSQYNYNSLLNNIDNNNLLIQQDDINEYSLLSGTHKNLNQSIETQIIIANQEKFHQDSQVNGSYQNNIQNNSAQREQYQQQQYYKVNVDEKQSRSRMQTKSNTQQLEQSQINQEDNLEKYLIKPIDKKREIIVEQKQQKNQSIQNDNKNIEDQMFQIEKLRVISQDSYPSVIIQEEKSFIRDFNPDQTSITNDSGLNDSKSVLSHKKTSSLSFTQNNHQFSNTQHIPDPLENLSIKLLQQQLQLQSLRDGQESPMKVSQKLYQIKVNKKQQQKLDQVVKVERSVSDQRSMMMQAYRNTQLSINASKF
eukprot:403350829